MLRKHLTFANVASALALFIALGGTAVALKANSVGSRQIKNDSIKGRDVGNGKLKGKDIAAGEIGQRELDRGALDPPQAMAAESTTAFCDPSSASFVDCGSAAVGITQPSSATLVAGGGQYGSATSRGSCKFRIDDSLELLSPAPPEVGDSLERSATHPNGFALTATSDHLNPLQPGNHKFALVCNELEGDVAFSTTLSVLTVGTG